MKNKTIAIYGIATYILTVITSASDIDGNPKFPETVIFISGFANFLFSILAIIRLWKKAKKASIILTSSEIVLFVSTAIHEITSPSYGSPIILLYNIARLFRLTAFIWAIIKLFKMEEVGANIKQAYSKSNSVYHKRIEIFGRYNLAKGRLLRLLILALVSIVMAVTIAFAYCVIVDLTNTLNDVSKSVDGSNILQDYVEDDNLKHAEVTETKDECQKQEIGVDVGIVTDITYIDGTPLAVIDGAILTEGQNIRRVKVAKINPDSVDFEYSGICWNQKINEQSSTQCTSTVDSRILPKHPTVEDIVKYVSPAVVTISTYDDIGDELSFGSGFFIDSGKILTNAHVIEGAYSAEVCSLQKTYEDVTIDKCDDDVDLAVLSVQSVREPTISLADNTDLDVGQRIIVIGNPLGFERTVSDGLISAIDDSLGFPEIQITAPISSGSSGGPMLNTDGLVIGIAYASMDEGQNLNFAIGIKTLKWFLKTQDHPVRLKKAGSYVTVRVVGYWIKNIVIGIVALAIGVISLIYIVKRLYRLVKRYFRRKKIQVIAVSKEDCPFKEATYPVIDDKRSEVGKKVKIL